MRKILNVNSNWEFIKNCENPESEKEIINIPHTWNAIDGQDGGNNYYRGKCLYKKLINKLELPNAGKYYLEINGANSSCDLYFNKELLTHHDGGYSTWRVNLTNLIKDENEIEIIVDNSANEEVYPQVADFTFYGGIYRDVNIIAVNETHFDLEYYGGSGVKITPIMVDGNANVSIETYITNYLNQEVKYEIYDKENNLVASNITNSLNCDFIIENPHLWHGVKDPYLYTAVVSIVSNDEVIDQLSVRFGCRSFVIDPERGFILNGKEYPLRGVSRHQDRWQFGNALLKEHHDEDMDLICEVGANTIRLAHYQHDQYFYDLCDERGMVVWAEIPYISKHMPDGNENTISQMKELIIQNYNHTSIVVWGLSNEITMDGADNPDLINQHVILNDLCHELDKTRLTTIACITMCGIDEEYVHIPDVIAYNHYFGWYGGDVKDNGPWFDRFHEAYPNLPIGCSEYGCEALNWHNSNPQQGDYSEEYQAYYHEELIKQLFTRKYIWATHVWNMFDFGADARAEGGENGQNHKGLITIDRKYKKDSFYAYKAWLSDEPFVHLCGKRYVDRVEDVTKITVYSNQEEVELFVNGQSVGKKKAPDHFFYFEVPNVGETKLVAVSGDLKDESTIRKVDKMNPDYILKEVGAVLNWFDITEVEGKCSLNDKIGDITKTLRGKIWFLGLFVALAKKQMGPNKKKTAKPKKKKVNKPKQAKKKTPKKKKSKSNNGGLMDMLNGFTVLRFTSMLGMRNINFTKEELLKMNKKLNKIKKIK